MFRLLLATLLIGLCVPAASALTFRSGERVHYSSLHRVDGDLLAASTTIITDGVIEGDMLVSGYRVTNSGEVTGSIMASSYEFRHHGKVGGSIRTFSYTCEIDGFVERSAMLFAGEITIGERAVIRHDLYAMGETALLAGTVLGNTDLKVDNITITGRIDGDAKLRGQKITILPPAVITGDLTYNADAEVDIDSLGGVTVLGRTTAVEPERTEKDDGSNLWTEIILFGAEFLGAFLFGTLLILVFKRQARETCRQIRHRFSVAAAAGVVTVLISLLSLVVLLCSLLAALIGFSMVPGESAHVGAILIVISTIMIPITTFTSVSGGILFYSGAIVIAVALGFVIVRLFRPEPAPLSKTQLLIGLFVAFLIFELPYAGAILLVLAGVIGAGGIVLGVRHCHQSNLPADGPSSPPKPNPDLPASVK